MGFSEADTRAKLIDPALHQCGWTEDLIRREETAGTIDVVDGRPRRRQGGRVDYVLRIKVHPDTEVERAGGLKALKPLGRASDVLRKTKERVFAA
ncbi:MAG: hypothetical protein HY906_18485 [Deltaproteobacteria bacterium]|nr:hypothetical protein [Deltaproteobacteria bacterium]